MTFGNCCAICIVAFVGYLAISCAIGIYQKKKAKKTQEDKKINKEEEQ